MTPITIVRGNFGGPDIREIIDADVEGDFGIHPAAPAFPDASDRWTVTHVPTGCKCLTVEHRVQAVAARAQFLASGLDWSFTDPQAVTADHKRIGKAIRRQYAD